MSEIFSIGVDVDRVKESDNCKIMLGCEEISNGTYGAGDKPFRVVQSDNRNVITVIADGYYNHIELDDIIRNVLSANMIVRKP